MCEIAEEGTNNPKIDQRSIFFEHTCGAEDERECTMMKHIIMAEIRKSNAPAWVSEELEKNSCHFLFLSALNSSKDRSIPRLVLFIVGNAKFYQEKKIPGNKIEI